MVTSPLFIFCTNLLKHIHVRQYTLKNAKGIIFYKIVCVSSFIRTLYPAAHDEMTYIYLSHHFTHYNNEQLQKCYYNRLLRGWHPLPERNASINKALNSLTKKKLTQFRKMYIINMSGNSPPQHITTLLHRRHLPTHLQYLHTYQPTVPTYLPT